MGAVVRASDDVDVTRVSVTGGGARRKILMQIYTLEPFRSGQSQGGSSSK